MATRENFVGSTAIFMVKIITLYEDKTVKIIAVALAKDAMQLKPGLLYDSKQGKLIGSTFNLNYDFIHKGETRQRDFES